MKKRRDSLFTAITVLIMMTFLVLSFAIVERISYVGENEALISRAPRLTTKTWAVFDPTSGNIEYGNNVDTPLPIASITKLFTAYMVMHTEALDTKVTITADDLATEGTFGKLKYGETLTLKDLLFPLLIESSNDAGTAITRTLGPLYPEAAKGVVTLLSLPNTRIADGTGLSEQNVSSPHDLALFYATLRQTYPRVTDITQLRLYLSGKQGLVNNNPARQFKEFTGGKQGYTPEAGKTFVGTFKTRNGKREVGIVLLASSDLNSDIEQILRSVR